MSDQGYLHYKLEVEPPMMAVMEQVTQDAAAFGITNDQVNRAVYRWVMERMVNGPVPEWYFQELDEIEEARQNGPVE